MRILSITAGAASMYCGSCLRDNALAAELIARGHDVTLLPLYTPLLTDEVNVSRPRVLFGGISIYLQQRSALLRRIPRLLDRVLDSPWLIKTFADRSVSTDPRLLGDLTISMLQGEDGVLRREFDKLRAWAAAEPAPDVLNLTNSMLIALARPLGEALGRPVCCTLQGEDLFLEGLTEPYRGRALELIRRQTRYVDRFIAVSDYYAAFMSRYLQVPPQRIAVVPIGINLAGFEQPNEAVPGTESEDAGGAGREEQAGVDRLFRVGYLARIAPEKGLLQLAEAFARFRKRAPEARARLDAAGYLAPANRPYLDEIRRSMERGGHDFVYHGAVDRAGKLAFLRQVDVLSVPATYDEPKGLSLLEAMASQVPVVQPRRGSFTEIVERTGGGLLVAPDDAESLADGLYTLWRDRALRVRLGRRGAEGTRAHYTIQGAADRLVRVYEDVLSGAGPRLAAAAP
jgi:glycosyltransferase involved in cell wall biosynthesis